jgi:predicted nucleotidyltransferase
LLYSKILNEHRRNTPYQSSQGRIVEIEHNTYVLPYGFDETPTVKDKVRMDHYLLDKDVYALLKMVYRGRLDKSFAWDHWAIANNCYSRPFCSIATNKLGYDDAVVLAGMEGNDNNRDISTQKNYPSDI